MSKCPVTHRYQRPSGTCKITPEDWRNLGGLKNSKLFRRQDSHGRWHHYACLSLWHQ
jgi:hypothetical protein